MNYINIIRHLICPLLGFGVLAGCHTGTRSLADPTNLQSSGAATAKAKDSVPSGYFMTVAATSGGDGSSQFYDKLYDAVEGQARKTAKTSGRLDSYLEEFQESGSATLSYGDDEIECDRTQCRLKLSGRHVGPNQRAADHPSFAERVFTALDEREDEATTSKAAKTTSQSAGERFIRNAAIGAAPGPHIACTETHQPGLITYECDFDLDRAKAGGGDVDRAETLAKDRGRLVGCVLSPGVVKTAEEAKGTIENGALLKLTSGAGDAAKTVGFLRFAHDGAVVELIDLYLCGDLSQDNFFFVGDAKKPSTWIGALNPSSPGAAGNVSTTLRPAHHAEADLTLAATRVAESTRDITLEVQFKIVPPTLDPPTGGIAVSANHGEAVFGEDEFFVKFPKEWLK